MTVGVRGGAAAASAAEWGPRAGLIGAAVFGAAVLVAAIGFGGPDGGLYSPLNHWVSELGEVGVSSLAAVFNAGLIVGGLGFAGFMAAFGAARRGPLAVAAAVLGIGAGVFGALVGVFPLGQSDLHRPVAIAFFLLGAITLALASAEIGRAGRREAAFPGWLAVAGAVVVAAFVGFIAVTLGRGTGEIAEPRAASLLEPALEWAAVGGLLAWTAVASITWARSRA